MFKSQIYCVIKLKVKNANEHLYFTTIKGKGKGTRLTSVSPPLGSISDGRPTTTTTILPLGHQFDTENSIN